MTHRRGREASERKRRIGQDEKAVGDGTTSHSMEVFQLGDIGNG